MVRAMVGNEIGVAAKDRVNETLLGTIVTDTANGFTVTAAEIRNFMPGQVIDVVVKTTGATSAGFVGRTVDAVNTATNTVTYSGADATLDTTYGAYLTGKWELASPVVNINNGPNDVYANLNGGLSESAGFDMAIFGSVDAMRRRLTAISATTYSAAELDKMTMNDMIYALRVNDAPSSI